MSGMLINSIKVVGSFLMFAAKVILNSRSGSNLKDSLMMGIGGKSAR